MIKKLQLTAFVTKNSFLNCEILFESENRYQIDHVNALIEFYENAQDFSSIKRLFDEFYDRQLISKIKPFVEIYI